MTCNVCFERTDGGPVIIVCVAMDDHMQELDHRFTGLVWHLDCAPTDRQHLQDEIRAIQAGRR